MQDQRMKVSRAKSAFSNPPLNQIIEIGKIQVTVVAIAFLALLIFIAYGVLPNRWYRVLLVYSGSMSPTIEAGDLIIISRPPETLQEGMILTLQVNEQLVTHRLIEITPDGQLITRGDANPVADDWSGQKVAVRGVYRGCIPYLGHVLNLPKQWMRVLQSGSWYSDGKDLQVMDFKTGAIKPIETLPSEPTKKPGNSANMEIQVDITALDNNALSIRLCLTNRGKAAPQMLKVVSEVYSKGEGNHKEPVVGTKLEIAIHDPIEPGSSFCESGVNYFPLEPGKPYIYVVHISYHNHAGWLPGEPNCPGNSPCAFNNEATSPFSLVAATPTPTVPTKPSVPPEQGNPNPTPTSIPTSTPTQILPTEQATQPPEMPPTEPPNEPQPPEPTETQVEPTLEPTPTPVEGL
jgi:signal peptidase I